LTPKWIIDAFGPFDLDPCAADPDGQSATAFWRPVAGKIMIGDNLPVHVQTFRMRRG
jgi:hypothetical protein